MGDFAFMKYLRLLIAYYRCAKSSADLLDWLAHYKQDYWWAVEYDRRKEVVEQRKMELNHAKMGEPL